MTTITVLDDPSSLLPFELPYTSEERCCNWCGNSITHLRPRAKYCCAMHRTEHYYAQRIERAAAKLFQEKGGELERMTVRIAIDEATRPLLVEIAELRSRLTRIAEATNGVMRDGR